MLHEEYRGTQVMFPDSRVCIYYTYGIENNAFSHSIEYTANQTCGAMVSVNDSFLGLDKKRNIHFWVLMKLEINDKIIEGVIGSYSNYLYLNPGDKIKISMNKDVRPYYAPAYSYDPTCLTADNLLDEQYFVDNQGWIREAGVLDYSLTASLKVYVIK